jgi:hypothetical protein
MVGKQAPAGFLTGHQGGKLIADINDQPFSKGPGGIAKNLQARPA